MLTQSDSHAGRVASASMHDRDIHGAATTATETRSRADLARLVGLACAGLLVIGGLGPQMKLSLANFSGVLSDALQGGPISEPFVIRGVVYVALALLAAAGLLRLRVQPDAPLWPLKLAGIPAVIALASSIFGLAELLGNSDQGLVAPGWGIYLAFVAAAGLLTSTCVIGSELKRRSH